MASNEEIIAMCATTQADVRNICQTLDGMKQFMGKQIEQHTTTNSRLAVIERVQSDMKTGIDTYTAECTKDRTAQDKRLSSVEGFQGRQLKMASVLAIAFSSVISGAVMWFKKG